MMPIIRVNFLPYREARRQQKKAAFYVLLALGALAGLGVVLLVGAYHARTLAIAQERHQLLETAISGLDQKIAQISLLKRDIAALQARQRALEDLQGARNLPVYLLDELARQTPSGVALKGMRQEGQTVSLEGLAQSQERVSELLRKLSGTSQWLERPDLIEVKSSTLGAEPRPGAAASFTARKIVEFKLLVKLKRGGDGVAGPQAAESGVSLALHPALGR